MSELFSFFYIFDFFQVLILPPTVARKTGLLSKMKKIHKILNVDSFFVVFNSNIYKCIYKSLFALTLLYLFTSSNSTKLNLIIERNSS